MNIYKLEFKSHLRSLFTWLLAISFIIFLLMAFFPSMQTKAMQDMAGAKLEGIPDSVLTVLGITKDALDLTNVFFFFSYVMQFINMALAVLAALMGANALIKEESDGTIEYLYAQPITRYQIVKNKMLATVSAFGLLTLLLSFITFIAFLVFGDGVNLIKTITNISKIFIGTFFEGTIFMALGFLGSTLLENTKKTATFSIAVVFGTFVIGVMSVVSEKLDFLLYLSPLDTVKPNKLINEGFHTTGVMFGLFVIVISTILCFTLYKKKDLKV